MSVEDPLLFFTTSACHLCEQALEIIEPLLSQPDLYLQPIDIVDHPDLMERYATRIPVVYDPVSQLELAWPFDQPLASEYLASCAASRKA